MKGPGAVQGYYRGDTFYYRVRCAKSCGWTGYRVEAIWKSCPHCGGAVD